MKSTLTSAPSSRAEAGRPKSGRWRHTLLAGLVFAPLVLVFLLPPVSQDLEYHLFADARGVMGIPNFLDVTSNAAFLGVGIAGLLLWYRDRLVGATAAWVLFFAGVALVGFGSAYYHLWPTNDTLVWDRLPITLAFMSMFVALLSESFGNSFLRITLAPALLTGLASVLYWHWFDDLRFYAWVQFMPLLAIPVWMALFRSRYSHRHWLLWVLGLYIVAKIVEIYDRQIFVLTNGVLAGHAVKHLFAAAGCLLILEMLRRRVRNSSAPST